MKVSSYAKLALAFSIVLSAACVLAGSPAGGYHLIKKVTYGAAPGIGATGRVFRLRGPGSCRAPHLLDRMARKLHVVNADTGEKVGSGDRRLETHSRSRSRA